MKSIREFLQLEAASGMLLLAAAIIALIFDNSALNHHYQHFISFPLTLGLGDFAISKALLLWINDGLMAIFFLLVGLEIKREILIGELNSLSKIALPGIAALGGMVVPALIYYGFNRDNIVFLQGWAIPTATDIAFALGILALLGSRVPKGLKVFLTALAILDDLGAIIIIAGFYTTHLAWLALGGAGICLLGLLILNKLKITTLIPYYVIGFILWLCILKSGIHATLAGVLLAFTIPLHTYKSTEQSPLLRLEQYLHPWVGFLILPLFAFANAGVRLVDLSVSDLVHPISLGITFGLLFGKQLGIAGTCWLAVKVNLAKLPEGIGWSQIYGMALICGIGFTMSLFIGSLAFGQLAADTASLIRLGVFTGSILSGICGYCWLLYAKNEV